MCFPGAIQGPPRGPLLRYMEIKVNNFKNIETPKKNTFSYKIRYFVENLVFHRKAIFIEILIMYTKNVFSCFFFSFLPGAWGFVAALGFNRLVSGFNEGWSERARGSSACRFGYQRRLAQH